MIVLHNKDFESGFPSEMTQINNDVVTFMDYPFVIQFKPYEEELAVKIAKCIGPCLDQLGIDRNGNKYFGCYR
jgi:hypothetical protein